jgi:hypothetical protein
MPCHDRNEAATAIGNEMPIAAAAVPPLKRTVAVLRVFGEQQGMGKDDRNGRDEPQQIEIVLPVHLALGRPAFDALTMAV